MIIKLLWDYKACSDVKYEKMLNTINICCMIDWLNDKGEMLGVISNNMWQ